MKLILGGENIVKKNEISIKYYIKENDHIDNINEILNKML